jgi:hypothetical protein
LTVITALLGTREPKSLANKVEQRHARVYRSLMFRAVNMDGQRDPVRWRGLKWFGGFLEERQAEGDTTRGTSECRNILSPRYPILGGMA